MRDKFTSSFEELLSRAQSIAIGKDHAALEPEHLLAASLENKEGIAVLLEKAGCSLQKQQSIVKARFDALPTLDEPDGDLNVSTDMANIFNLMDREVQKRSLTSVGADVFTLALLQSKSHLGQTLVKAGASVELLRTLTEPASIKKQKAVRADGQKSALDKYTVDLTERAREGRLDPVIGRDEEIRRVMQILSRRTKNNPTLIGEPGVGKTAIVEGLALRLINKEAPDVLWDKRVLSLDLASLLAGAKFRGEFEERLKTLLKEVTDAGDEIILFIDEIHTLVGAGKGEGAMDAGNMLKPALARGELRCIGATTLDEYRTGIEKDPALERRFQRVLVQEPDVPSAIAILRGLKERYELHHRVTIQDAAIVAAVELSQRYITDRFLPDKAIDLIDEAASRIKLEMSSKPEAIDKIDRRLVQLKIEQVALSRETDDASKKRLYIIEDEIAQLEEEQDQLMTRWQAEKAVNERRSGAQERLDHAKTELSNLIRDGQYEKASRLQYEQIPQLEKEAKEAAEPLPKAQNTDNTLLARTVVSPEEIAQAVSKATGIPVQKMMGGEREKLLHMEEILSERVAGQPDAIKAVSEAIRRSRMGISDPNRPIGSFLFLGPTGVGKTELAKSLASFLFDTEQALVRIDMSEYMEKHSVSRLIGAPPGYVGYDEGGQLTETVRRRPYAVLLLDEIEKAHPDVLNVLLQLLDEGRLTDGQGRLVDFKNTVVIMTSNLAAEAIQEAAEEGPLTALSKALIIDEAKQELRPELYNRIDEIQVFEPLPEDAIRKIADIQCTMLTNRLAKQGIELRFDDSALSEIANAGYDIQYGARPLKRAVQQLIENPLAKQMLMGNVTVEHPVRVYAEMGIIRFESILSEETSSQKDASLDTLLLKGPDAETQDELKEDSDPE